jgi:Sporulation and spore germination
MPRSLKITLAVLAILVGIGVVSFQGLRRRAQRLGELQKSEEQARQEVVAPPISTASDVTVQAKIFWASGPDAVAPMEVAMPLSSDPVERSKQLLQELIAKPPSPEQQTLPADTTVLGFYVLPDGTAVADFSDAISSELPSGILSEEVAVNSITQTLANNVPSLARLKILIHGQESDTLAGHVDLTGFFDLNPGAATTSGTTTTSGTNNTPGTTTTSGAALGAAAAPPSVGAHNVDSPPTNSSH